MARTHPILTIVLAVLALALAGSAQAKAHHHKDGQQLVSAHIKTNGEHVIDKHGKHTATAQVVNGKIAGIKVKHSEKGDVPVKKVKTNKKMAQPTASRSRRRTGFSRWGT